MTEVSRRYRATANAFTLRVKGIPAGGWSSPTPCPNWTVQDLVGHVTGVQVRVLATLDQTEPTEVDLQGDLEGQWLVASNAIADALEDEALAARSVPSRAG